MNSKPSYQEILDKYTELKSTRGVAAFFGINKDRVLEVTRDLPLEAKTHYALVDDKDVLNAYHATKSYAKTAARFISENGKHMCRERVKRILGKYQQELPSPRLLSFVDRDLSNADSFIVSSAVSNAPVDIGFLSILEHISKKVKAPLVISPTFYKNVSLYQTDAPYSFGEAQKYIVDTPQHGDKVYLALNAKVQATSTRPLNGLHMLAQQDTIIVGHPIIQHTSLPSMVGRVKRLYTTGCVTHPSYTETAAGVKATHSQQLGALYVTDQGKVTHLTYSNFSVCFNGMLYFYKDGKVVEQSVPVEAVVVGDLHWKQGDIGRHIFRVLKDMDVNKIFWHDIMDLPSLSRHKKGKALDMMLESDSNSLFLDLHSWKKLYEQLMEIEAEHIIVASNHTEGRIKNWLNDHKELLSENNAFAYAKCLLACVERKGEPLLQVVIETLFGEKYTQGIKFLTYKDSLVVADYQVALHGDKGVHGARGSNTAFSRLHEKTITGHSHVSSITGNQITVGSECNLDQGYNVGFSAWSNTSVAINANGSYTYI
jgi:hypothetical protein